MLRMALGLGLVAVSFTLAGCRMCQHPFDYRGPVYDYAPDCQSCSMQSRAGSILENTSVPMPTLAPTPTPARAEQYQEYTEGEMRLGDVPGSEQILSVTDRVVEPAVVATESSQMAGRSSPTSPDTLPATGWTARRSVPAMRR
ncbi:MAG: hypothetical protein K8R46_01735 [Pirellulales bacterium]|nr:hypothetical protein [Pirellulales bacterium]